MIDFSNERHRWLIGGALAVYGPGAVSFFVWISLWDWLPAAFGVAAVLIVGGALEVRRTDDPRSRRVWAAASWFIAIGFVMALIVEASPAGQITILMVAAGLITWMIAGGIVALLLLALSERLRASIPSGPAGM